MSTKILTNVFLTIALCLFSFAVPAQEDSPANRQVAVDRYLSAAPMNKMLDDIIEEYAKQVPQDQRAIFISNMKATMHADALERIARDAMLRIYTADELNALADFYGSKNGASAMKKFGAYTAQIMPAIQQEIIHSLQQLQTQKK